MAEKQSANTLGRLNDVLFAELERLDALDPTVDKEIFDAEIERSKALQGVAKEINQSAQTIVKSIQFRAEWAGAKAATVPKMLEG